MKLTKKPRGLCKKLSRNKRPRTTGGAKKKLLKSSTITARGNNSKVNGPASGPATPPPRRPSTRNPRAMPGVIRLRSPQHPRQTAVVLTAKSGRLGEANVSTKPRARARNRNPTPSLTDKKEVSTSPQEHLQAIAPRAHTDTTNNVFNVRGLFKSFNNKSLVFNTINDKRYVDSSGLYRDLNALSKLIKASEEYYRGNINTIKEKYYKALEENEMTSTSFKKNYMIDARFDTQELELRERINNQSNTDVNAIMNKDLLELFLERLSKNLENYKKRLVDEENSITTLIEKFKSINIETVSDKNTLTNAQFVDIIQEWNVITTTNVAVLMFLNEDIEMFLEKYYIKMSNIQRIRNLLKTQMKMELLFKNQETFAHTTRMQKAQDAVTLNTRYDKNRYETPTPPTPDELRRSHINISGPGITPDIPSQSQDPELADKIIGATPEE